MNLLHFLSWKSTGWHLACLLLYAEAPINLKQMQITSTCHSVILFILKVQVSLPNFQNFSQFSEEKNFEHRV